jgi:chromosome segregation ATPase
MSSLDNIVISLLNDFYVGWEKAEAEAVSLKGELDEASQQRVAGEERVAHLDAALRECMQQLRFVREEQEKRIHDAVTKTSKDFEKSQMILEEKLSETSKRLAKLGVENSHISNALLVKEKLIEDVNKQLTQMESDFSALMTRLQSTEKDNASLKYEVRVLEKELEIRNEEREFNRRTADASHKQHLESVKKIAKLESEVAPPGQEAIARSCCVGKNEERSRNAGKGFS